MLITNLTDVDYWFGPMHLLAGSGQTLTLDDSSDTSLYLLNDEVADAVNTLYLASNITVSPSSLPFPRPTGTPALLHGDGSPEGMVYAPQGSLYMRRDSQAAGTSLYTKTTGVTQNLGWISVLGSGMDTIQQITLASAGPSINFASIPQGYTNLKIIASLGTSASSPCELFMTVNGSSGGTAYFSQMIQGVGNNPPEAVSNPSLAYLRLGFLPIGAYFGTTEITLTNYTNPTDVSVVALNGSIDSVASTCQYTSGLIETASTGGAISSITLSADVSDDFRGGSTATLFGILGNAI